MRRRVLLAGILALTGICPIVAAVSTSEPPPRELTAAPADPHTLALASRLAPAAHVFNAVAVDLDRDGDLDVIATSSEAIVVVWLNDGRDRYVRHQPTGSRMLDGGPRLGDRDSAWPAVSALSRSNDAALIEVIRVLADASRAGHHAPPARGADARDLAASLGRGPPAPFVR